MRTGPSPRLAKPGSLARHFDWLLAVAESISRPDLTALVFAAAHQAGVPDAHQRWRIWSGKALGDVAGVPSAPLGTRKN